MSKFERAFIRGYNNYDVKAVSDDNATSPGEEPSLTQQHFRDECDVNKMMERFHLTGELPTNVRAPMYGDFTGVNDYRSALHAVMDAEDSFMQLPAAVRRKFDNDPALFVDFCSDPANIDAMREMGLAVKKEIGDGQEQRRGDERVGSSDRREASSSDSGGGGDGDAARRREGGVGAGERGRAGPAEGGR